MRLKIYLDNNACRYFGAGTRVVFLAILMHPHPSFRVAGALPGFYDILRIKVRSHARNVAPKPRLFLPFIH